MSTTMGIATTVYNNGNNGEQLMLLRTLQDNERNIIGNNSSPTNRAKNNVSVINVNVNVAQQQRMNNENNDQNSRRNQQQQNNALPPYDPSRLKKHGKNGQPPPIAVAKRNARERNRVKQVNNGFATLRQHIPSHVAQGYGDRGKKLSKVETLRMAVEYIRGLQRLLAEADGLDYDAMNANSNQNNQTADSSMMIPSPTGSVYSNGTHNGSSDLLCMDEQQSAGGENVALDDDVDGEAYLVDEDDDEDEKERKDCKRFRPDDRSQNRLSENQNRASLSRRHRNSPTTYYVTRQTSSFGDEENIEPLTTNRNNNNTNANNNNNNNLLASFSPILLQTDSPPINASLSSIKREIRLLDEDESRRSTEDQAVILASSAPYTGEILIENPETGRFIPLKLEEHEASAQLVYVSASTDDLPASAYYKHELVGATSGTETITGTEFMDVVSWWEQEQGRLVHQLQGVAHHHHAVVQTHHHQPAHHHQQHHQQITHATQRLAHV